MKIKMNSYTNNIRNYLTIKEIDTMPPFLMNIVSDGDLWMFAGSNGTLTAGRGNPDKSLFPYETADKLLRFPLAAGSLSQFIIHSNADQLWEPWIDQSPTRNVERNLHKHIDGSALCFEEKHLSYNLMFRWEWSMCDTYGIVRTCTLINTGDTPTSLTMLDGLNRILPAGIDQALYEKSSYLAEAYMRHERLSDLPMAIFTLNAPISDVAEPAEQLTVSYAATLGITPDNILISSRQLDAFRAGKPIKDEYEERGAWGMFLASKKLELAPGESVEWMTITDTQLDHARLKNIIQELHSPEILEQHISEAVTNEQSGLRARIGMADGLQSTGDKTAAEHHFSNVLYNCLRGGTFPSGYICERKDFIAFIQRNNKEAALEAQHHLQALPATFTLQQLHENSALINSHTQIKRLIQQYLPITFSRRHGDPSRPWNRFDIRVRDSHGKPVLAYQGNWRDIFQNWESLAQSYPEFIGNIRTLFLNATSAEGYNPYRITSDGIDWECPDPDDPWANIGYWGDHQIIYLLRLLETEENYFPGSLASRLNEQLYAHANIPYRIADFDAICQNPKSTIQFDNQLHEELHRASETLGADGKLLKTENGEIHLVTLGEKLLIPLLTKLTNFVAGGGIWLNTQRPEWNDANNALAGYGLSMVTVCYIRRYLTFLQQLLQTSIDETTLQLNESTAQLLLELTDHFSSYSAHEAATSPITRAQLTSELGRSGQRHRNRIYNWQFGQNQSISLQKIETFIEVALLHINTCIKVNHRADQMIHSYNLVLIEENQFQIKHLGLMLEGQVAFISSGWLSGADTVALYKQLRNSALFREDQHSYLLYPDNQIPSFLSKNTLSKEASIRIPTLQKLLEKGDYSVVKMSHDGSCHFNAAITNQDDLNHVLDRLATNPEYTAHIEKDRSTLLAEWENIFNHHAFTGRSSRFFAFEGLGSIYWHMISKLLLGVQEKVLQEDDPSTREELHACYEDIRLGLGFTKSPQVYGAFPTDAYSHTPRHIGAQQPGMTGQVKEEILTRQAELGIQVKNGCIHFIPNMIQDRDFSVKEQTFTFYSLQHEWKEMNIPPQSFVLTFCQTPIIFQYAEKQQIEIMREDHVEKIEFGSMLTEEISKSIFAREGKIAYLIVNIPPANRERHVERTFDVTNDQLSSALH